ncbi:Formin-like protein 18 [Gossypium australe]|uniref:Formin-like protein 18 n=1 Tax=Gossypium australe TaxID=47621 RepID=A0A5B6W803_9ROSI|nr:Formin-like protein 18 [Gossypium australe]
MGRTYGVSCRKLMGRVQVIMDLGLSQAKPLVFRNGRTKLGNESDKANAKLHLTVRAELDPQFLFQFGEKAECSLVVFQIQGNIRKPMFSYKFKANRSKFRFYGQEERMDDNIIRRKRKARKKGWMIMIYDLSSSPVTSASMITPLVASPSSDRVSRSNLGHLETWRERCPIDGLGYKFELVASQHGSEGKISKLVVQVGIHHVTCMADDALFVALSTAIDLSTVASCKLRKELCHDEEDPSS